MENNLINVEEKDLETDKSKEPKSFSKLLEKIKSGNVPKILIVIISVVLLLIIIFCNFGGEKEASTVVTDQLTTYVTALENKLANTLSNVKGAGKVSVVISVESGNEMVLATKTTTTTDIDGKILTEETPIIVNGKTVVLKELTPKITGVLIVSQGANSIQVMQRLQQATKSLLDVNINQIEILTMK